MDIKQLQKNFESLASEDPLWTVLSDNSKRGGQWDVEEFYATGEPVIADLGKRLELAGLSFQGKTAIDFGCGVGRLTFPLGKRFAQCYGVDISQSMIDYARSEIHRGPNCQFIINTFDRLDSFKDNSIDFVYTAIVLQHIAPRYIYSYLREFSRVLRQGGILAFQLPSHLNKQSSANQKPLRMLQKRAFYRAKSLKQKISRWLPFISSDSYFEMNAIPRKKIIDFLESQCRLKVIDAQDFPAAGDNWISYLYLARKSG